MEREKLADTMNKLICFQADARRAIIWLTRSLEDSDELMRMLIDEPINDKGNADKA